MPEHDTPDAGRRGLLKLAAIAPAAALGGVAAGEARAEVAAGETRLQDTEHTRAAYATARF